MEMRKNNLIGKKYNKWQFNKNNTVTKFRKTDF
mgnify:CR=1 FL=1